MHGPLNVRWMSHNPNNKAAADVRLRRRGHRCWIWS